MPNLTGTWKQNSNNEGANGFVYISQIKNDVFWAGFPVEGREWANVACGQINGTEIEFKWSNTPNAESTGGGTITVSLSADCKTMTKKSGRGKFYDATDWEKLPEK